MIQGITARYIEVGTYHLQALPLVVADRQALEDAASALRAKKGVAAYPEFQGYGVAISGSRTAGVAVRAVDPAFLEDAGTAAYLKLGSGEMRLDGVNQILLGEPLAKKLGAAVGDTVSIVTSRPTYSGTTASFAPKVSVFRVRGIVSAGYRELDALWAFVSLRAAPKIFWTGRRSRPRRDQDCEALRRPRGGKGLSHFGSSPRMEGIDLAGGRAQYL